MSSEWKLVELESVAAEGGFASGPFGSNLGRKDYTDSGIPVIRGKNLGTESEFNLEDLVFVSSEKAHGELARNLALPGDIVVTQRGTLGQVGVVPIEPYEAYVVSQSQMRLRLDETVADPGFVYLVFRSPQMIRQIHNEAITTGVPHINLEIFKKLSFSCPSLLEQRRIAWVLGTLDDKIELNRKIARTLEEIAATIFKARFVDFEGVEEFEDSEIGPIPKGWEWRSLDEVADYVNGGAFTKGASGTGRPVIRIRELNGSIGPDTPRSDRDVPDSQIAREFDLLFSWSGSLNVYRWSGEESLINQHIFKVIPKDEIPSWFVEQATKQHLPVFQAIAASKATTMGHIQRHHLTDAKVALPSTEELQEISREVAPLNDLRNSIIKEAGQLTALRDELLPKLISGAIRVPEGVGPDSDADAVVEELVEA